MAVVTPSSGLQEAMETPPPPAAPAPRDKRTSFSPRRSRVLFEEANQSGALLGCVVQRLDRDLSPSCKPPSAGG